MEIGWAGIAAPDSRRSIVSEGSRRPRTRFTRRVVLNGHPEYRLPNTLNVAFPNHVGADILARLDGVAASTGSACHSGRVELSPVLTAMGIRPEIGMGAIRFSLGRYTAIEEIDAVVDADRRSRCRVALERQATRVRESDIQRVRQAILGVTVEHDATCEARARPARSLGNN